MKFPSLRHKDYCYMLLAIESSGILNRTSLGRVEYECEQSLRVCSADPRISAADVPLISSFPTRISPIVIQAFLCGHEEYCYILLTIESSGNLNRTSMEISSMLQIVFRGTGKNLLKFFSCMWTGLREPHSNAWDVDCH